MNTPRLCSLGVLLTVLATLSPIQAQTSVSSEDQLKSMIAVRQQRVDLLREEIQQTDARIESRLDAILDTLNAITDSKDSRTKATRMKEDTAKELMKTIQYYDRKRAALREELRMPRLRLTADEKRKMIAAFDTRIEKRIQQILALNRSMPSQNGYSRQGASDQSRRMASHDNLQRDAILKQLEGSITRLERQASTLKIQLAATADPLQRKPLNEELAKTETLITERRKQRVETMKPSGSSARSVTQSEAMDLDKALQDAIADLRQEFNVMFGCYNTLLNELSTLHMTEAHLPTKVTN